MQARITSRTCALFGLLVAVVIYSPAARGAEHSTRSMGMGGTNMMERCQKMMQERQKMMSEMKQQDQKLQTLAAGLNQGSEQQKVDRLVEVVQQLVKDRSASHERMEAMQDKMMQHMGQHMQQGGTSMAQCPMMHGMGGMGTRGMGSMGGSAEDSQKGQAQQEGSGSSQQ